MNRLQQAPASMAGHTEVVETLSLPNLTHPFTEFCLADAVALANNNRRLNMLPEVTTLSEARSVVEDINSRTDHVWMTGLAALDVLDAAIDNRDLLQSSRFR